MDPYRFDKTVFKIKTYEEADADNVDLSLSLSERLRQAWYLTSKAYGFDLDNPPRMDKTVFSCRKMDEGDKDDYRRMSEPGFSGLKG